MTKARIGRRRKEERKRQNKNNKKKKNFQLTTLIVGIFKCSMSLHYNDVTGLA